jgi:hypothetical protein
LARCTEVVTLTTHKLIAALTLLSFRGKNVMPEELFFLFIASCISLWLIQLATESIERSRDSRRIQRGTARERSRGHLILVKRIKNLTRMIECNRSHPIQPDNLTFRDVQLPGPTSYFPTKTSAEKRALKEAKLWVGLIAIFLLAFASGCLPSYRRSCNELDIDPTVSNAEYYSHCRPHSSTD